MGGDQTNSSAGAHGVTAPPPPYPREACEHALFQAVGGDKSKVRASAFQSWALAPTAAATEAPPMSGNDWELSGS